MGPNGVVYAQDIQTQMIEAINRRVQQEGLVNVRTILGTPTDPRLPTGALELKVEDVVIQSAAEPLPLTQALMAQRHAIGQFKGL